MNSRAQKWPSDSAESENAKTLRCLTLFKILASLTSCGLRDARLNNPSYPLLIMLRLLLLLGSLLSCLLGVVSGTALTYKLAPNEKACFFAYAETKGQKLAFYFAVRPPLSKWL